MDDRRHYDARRFDAGGRGNSQLLPGSHASTHEPAHACVSDNRHPRLDPQSHLSRLVSRIRGHRRSRAKPMDPDPGAASGNHDPLWRGPARGGVSGTALRQYLSGLQGPRAPLAVASTRALPCWACAIGERMRSTLILIGVLAFVLVSCAAIPTSQEANDVLLELRKYGSWAWALGIVLIWADLLLPIPQTGVIAALGIIYGTVIGGLLGSLGLITSGLLGYGLMFTSARRLVHRFSGPHPLHRMESLFDRSGAWAIILTRSLPYSVPEAMVFLAGLAGMPLAKFVSALTVGSVPTAFAFAAIGGGWADRPMLALVLSYVLPIVLLPIALYLMRLRVR